MLVTNKNLTAKWCNVRRCKPSQTHHSVSSYHRCSVKTNLTPHTNQSNSCVAIQLTKDNSRHWTFTERNSMYLSCGWDPLVSLPCEMEPDTDVRDHRDTNCSLRFRTDQHLQCHDMLLGWAKHCIQASKAWQTNATRSHLNPSWFTCNNFPNPLVCSPTHPVWSYHSLVPLADTKALLMLSVHWGEVLRRKPSPLKAPMEDGWSCMGWIINRCSL